MRAIREHVQTAVDTSFAALEFAERRFNCPYHYHPEAELTLIVKGRGQRLVGDHFGSFAPGDLVLHGADLPHTYFHAPEFDDGPRGAHSTVIQFLPTMNGGWLQESPECRSIRRLLERARRGLHFSSRRHAATIERIRELPRARGVARLTLLLAILNALSTDTRARPLASVGYQPVASAAQARRIERVTDWLTAHFREPLTLGQAARQAHLSPGAFSRFFRRATNRPFVRFVNELRVGHACRLLVETDQSIAEVAFASGYENLSNFNRRFRELRGLTPGEFRRRATLLP